MRVTEARYARDRSKHDLAYKLLALGARNQTVTQWTGLTQYQVRVLGNTYSPLETRLRGPAPSHIGWFWHSVVRRQHAAILACIFYRCRFIDRDESKNRREFITVERGFSFCRAYHFYCGIFAEPAVPLEYAMLLLWELNRREVLSLGHCSKCPAAVLVDRLGTRHPDCGYCSGKMGAVSLGPAEQCHSAPICPEAVPARERRRPRREFNHQESLF